MQRQFQNISWCKPEWDFPNTDEDIKGELRKCIDIPKAEVTDDVKDIIRMSKDFPIPFPIDSVRLAKLLSRRPVEKLKKNIVSTYPIIHERVLLLMSKFLIYKRKYGSCIEKELYKDMTVPELIDRMLMKRSVTFMGPKDKYMLLSGHKDRDGWEAVGTPQQKPPLVLENCLSYDEMKLSAMVYVSGPTECINDGERRNKGVIHEDGIEKDAIIIGIIGARFKRVSRMDYEDMLITEEQNTTENGYGSAAGHSQSPRHMWRQLWAEFFQVESYTYDNLKSNFNIQKKPTKKRYMEDRFVYAGKDESVFDNEVYYKRLCIIAETTLLEADERARQEGREAFLNIIGAGLGVWKTSPHQEDVFILTFLERITSFLHKDFLNHVTDINFAYIKPSDKVLGLFKNIAHPDGGPKIPKIFLDYKNHPRGGINVQLESREPSAKLRGEHKGKLLVMTYPWDGNAHPGNEFWIGKLASSGDPAAACSTQVSELHNAHINPAVTGYNVKVAGRSGVKDLQECCAVLTGQ